MFKDITSYEVALLSRALNTERNTIERMIKESPQMRVEFEKQHKAVVKLLQEAQEKDAELFASLVGETANG